MLCIEILTLHELLEKIVHRDIEMKSNSKHVLENK